MTDQMIERKVNELQDRIEVHEDKRYDVIEALMGLDPLLGIDSEYSELWDGDVPNADILCRCVGKATLAPEFEGQVPTLKELRPILIGWLSGLDDKIQSMNVILDALIEDD